MNAHLGRLPQMRDELKDLRQRIKELEDTTNKNQQDKSKCEGEAPPLVHIKLSKIQKL